MKFLLYQEVSAFGLPQRDAYHLKSWEKRAMCTKVSYNATFDRRRLFLYGYIAERCQKIGFFNLCRLFQRPFIRLHKKTYLGFAVPTGLSEEEAESFLGLHSVVDSWSGQGTVWMWNNFFAIVFALCDNILRLSSPQKLPQVCVHYYHSALFECLCEVGVTPKTIELKYLWKIIERARPLGKFFVSEFVVLCITHSCQIWNLGAVRHYLVNSCWLPLTFEMTKFPSSANFCLQSGWLPCISAVIS